MHIVVADAPAAIAAGRIAAGVRNAVRRRGEASLALSGGSTAPAMIAALAALDLPWGAVTVWQVDERIAPDGDPARNALQLEPLPCRTRLMPVTATDLRASARRYSAGLPDRLDLVHLGLGGDGHTASWPPDRPDVAVSERHVEITAPFNGHARMTLTRRVVNRARSRLVLATGSGKRSVVERWLLDDPTLPIDAVRRTATTVVLDAAAAPDPPL